MATVRNKSEHTLDLRCIGRGVAPDEQAEVPDETFDLYTWPDTVWSTSRDSKAEPKKPAKKAAASTSGSK